MKAAGAGASPMIWHSDVHGGFDMESRESTAPGSSSRTSLRFGYLTPILALSLGTVLTALASVQTANAQNLNAVRERNLRECNLAEALAKPDSEERSKTGARGFRYKACMMERGDIE
jgi:hypothetical protein